VALTLPRAARRRTGGSDLRYAGEALPVEALSQDGLLIRSDGAFVRYLEVIPTNPLVFDEDGCNRLTRGFTELYLRVPAGMSVQLYAQATHVALEDLLARMRVETDAAAAPLLELPDRRGRGQALRALAGIHEESLAVHAEDQAALEVRFVLVVPYLPDVASREPGRLRRPRRRRGPVLERDLGEHLHLVRESLQHTDQLRSALTGVDMKVRAMSGPEIADLLWGRLSPQMARTLPAQAPSRHALRALDNLDHAVAREQAVQAARRLRGALSQGALDFSDPRRVCIDGDLEHTIYVAKRPERTFYGWLLHAMQSQRPWTLSVHVHMLDRAEMRARYAAKEKRLSGLNVGRAEDGRRTDRDQVRQEAEYAELIDGDLATGAESLCDIAIYQSIREPGPDPDPRALGVEVIAAMRALAGPVDAHVQRGEVMQGELWRSTLPLGLDVARRTFRVVTRNAADSTPFVSTSCGSPGGIPFAFADPGRTVEALNPHDRLHDNGVMLVFAKSGGGKTATVINLITAAMARGAQANVIDRSTGHYAFPCALVPGSVHLEPGDDTPDAPVINPWDVEDPANVPRRKIAFLVRLHALLIGDHDGSADSYGLGSLERTLLALAVREVYARAAAGQGIPCESFLRAVLEDLARREGEDPHGSGENTAVYRNLAHRLGEFCGDGAYGYLLDRPTTVGAHDAPLLVFNTRKVPDDEQVATAVVFIALEHIIARVERRYERHLHQLANGHTPAGPFEGTSVVVLEELWKLIRRRATREWVIEQAKRARHIGLWLIAITQQRSDLASDEAKALLVNSSMQLFLRLGPEELEHAVQALGLSHEEREQIKHLTTEKRAYAQAYLINGERGRGTLSIRLGSHLYWTCTSDPHEDLPLRERALTQAGFYAAPDELTRARAAFAALDLLADPAWHGTAG
jgi:hypothetical protein